MKAKIVNLSDYFPTHDGLVRCKECGHEWATNWALVNKYALCPECNHKNEINHRAVEVGKV